MCGGLPDNDSFNKHYRLPFSVYGSNPRNKTRGHFTCGFGGYDGDALSAALGLAEDLCDYRVRGPVFQRLCSDSTVLRKSASLKSTCANTDGAAVCDCTGLGAGTFCCPVGICCQEISCWADECRESYRHGPAPVEMNRSSRVRMEAWRQGYSAGENFVSQKMNKEFT
jgi:hypothetical protein